VGLNKATWRVGDHWLSADYPRAAESVRRLTVLLDRLAAELGTDLTLPVIVDSQYGPVVEAAGRVWWLTRNVDGRHPDPTSLADTVAVATGLARLHTALRDLPGDLAVSSDTCEGLFRAGAEIVNDDRLGFTPDDLAVARTGVAVVSERLDALRKPGTQLTHGDPSNPNLFVSDGQTRLTGAIDWDYARNDLVLSDLATVAQTVLFRSGTGPPRRDVQAMVDAYITAGGIHLSTDEILLGVIMVLFEAIAHHGARYIRGEGDHDRVSGRVDNIRTVLALLGP
jgi:macrolide phosphotransferase